MIGLAAITGYLIGSVPTAVWLGKLWGVDLRRGGTGNPGANNARRLGGLPLAFLVLVVEMAKGMTAVAAGLAWSARGVWAIPHRSCPWSSACV